MIPQVESEPALSEAMSEANTGKDQSMEEILQSIKRIIADEEVAPAQGASEPAAESPVADGKVKGSDILELKDLVDTQVHSEMPSGGQDILGMIDASLEVAPPAPPPPAPQPEPAPAPAPQHIMTEPSMPATPKQEDVLANIDTLLDDQAVKISANALQSLKEAKAEPAPAPVMETPKTPSPVFRSGTTLEDLALEALKPELKQWLNANLPAMVERMVSAEIKKITGKA
jgi:uncharacterized protein